MTADELTDLGDEFRRLVLARTGLTSATLKCPREKSDMTPCVARDGGVCVIVTLGTPVCVGCGTNIPARLGEERRHLGA